MKKSTFKIWKLMFFKICFHVFQQCDKAKDQKINNLSLTVLESATKYQKLWRFDNKHDK